MKVKRIHKVQTGRFRWCGLAENVEEAVIAAFAKKPPERLGELVKIHDGFIWWYLDLTAALKLAGYTVKI